MEFQAVGNWECGENKKIFIFRKAIKLMLEDPPSL